MATIITGHWGNNYSPQAQLDVNVSSQNGGSVTYSYTLKYVTNGYVAYTNGQARGYTISIDGQNIGGSININGIGTTTVKTGTVTVSKSNSARNIGFSITFDMSVSWAGAWKTTVYASGAIGVPARESHTVSYNANGGSGAPSAQTKWYGSILTLSGTKPSRYGYTFQGWCKNSATGSANYQPNSQYGYDENATMYAVWSPNPYTITYNANGGTGAPSNQTKYHDQNITLSGTRPSKTNYNFLGWATSSGATSASYQPSSTYTQNSNITLYAVWQLAYKAPRISNVTADRSNSGGTYQETGQYAKVSFSWSTDKTVSGVKIEWKSSTSSTWSSATASASGTNGTVNQVIGNNGISTEYTYNIRITVSDSVGSSTYNIDVPAMLYTMDFKAGGKGVAIGKPATNDNLFDVSFETNFDKNVKTSGYFYQKGKSLIDMFYPVGSIFITTVSTNPSSYMGGTWVRIANGQTLVGVNENDSDFNAPFKTGGEKRHTLTQNEMPSHSHEARDVNGHKAYFWAWSGGPHPSPTLWIHGGNVSGGAMPAGGNPLMSKQSWEGYTTTNTGGGNSHNNLQPYITVYMWRRTA